MIEPDTIRLLRECDAGIKMGISSIDGVQDQVKYKQFTQKLTGSSRLGTRFIFQTVP